MLPALNPPEGKRPSAEPGRHAPSRLGRGPVLASVLLPLTLTPVEGVVPPARAAAPGGETSAQALARPAVTAAVVRPARDPRGGTGGLGLGGLPLILGGLALTGLAAAALLARAGGRAAGLALAEDVSASVGRGNAAAIDRRPGGSDPSPPPAPDDLRRLHDSIPVAVALLDREGRFLSVNASFAALSGRAASDHLRRRPREVLAEDLAGPIEAAHTEVLATGRPLLDRRFVAGAPGEGVSERHLSVSCQRVPDGEDGVSGVSLVLQDVTGRVRAEWSRELLVRELNHRVKNTLATVQSITIATLRQGNADPRSLSAALVARMMALARAHDLLTAHAWAPADLAEVVRVALGPWIEGMPDRLSPGGPTGILLRPLQAQALVLALHELATNAVKHGSLSNDTGQVCLRWGFDAAGGRTTLTWQEIGGPPVTEPAHERRGFGTRLLERALGSDLGLGGEVRLLFAPDGLQATIAFSALPPPVAAGAWSGATSASPMAASPEAARMVPAAAPHRGGPQRAAPPAMGETMGPAGAVRRRVAAGSLVAGDPAAPLGAEQAASVAPVTGSIAAAATPAE
jgi:PAS domain S-box-containing protein